MGARVAERRGCRCGEASGGLHRFISAATLGPWIFDAPLDVLNTLASLPVARMLANLDVSFASVPAEDTWDALERSPLISICGLHFRSDLDSPFPVARAAKRWPRLQRLRLAVSDELAILLELDSAPLNRLTSLGLEAGIATWVELPVVLNAPHLTQLDLATADIAGLFRALLRSPLARQLSSMTIVGPYDQGLVEWLVAEKHLLPAMRHLEMANTRVAGTGIPAPVRRMLISRFRALKLR